MDMFIRTNRYSDKKKYEINESEVNLYSYQYPHNFVSECIHAGISTRVEKVQSLPSKHTILVLFAEDKSM